MEEAKFAELDNEKLKEIKQLEDKLDVTLIAYDLSASKNQTYHENAPIVINPS